MGLMKKLVGWLGLGKLPAKVRAELEADGGIDYLAEGIPATAIFESFRAPGVYCGYRWMTFIGYLALSGKRIVTRAGSYNRVDINIALDDPRFKAIDFSIKGERLSLAYDPSVFSPGTSGHVGIRLSLPDAPRVLTMIEEKRERKGGAK